MKIILHRRVIVMSLYERQCSFTKPRNLICVKYVVKYEPRCEKTGLRGPTRSYTNRTVQPHKMVTGLKLCMQEVEVLYFLCSENKNADQLRGYREADLRLCFRICKKPVFSRRGSYLKRKEVLPHICLSILELNLIVVELVVGQSKRKVVLLDIWKSTQLIHFIAVII